MTIIEKFNTGTKTDPAIKDIEDFTFEDFELLDYNPHPHIKGAVAV